MTTRPPHPQAAVPSGPESRSGAPSLSPAPAAVGAPPLADPEDALLAICATGLSRWEALGLLACEMGEEAVRAIWNRWASQRTTTLAGLLGALDEVAGAAPATANDWLGAWLAGRTMPEDLNLRRHPWVTSLPDGLGVKGSLDLRGTQVANLPKGLKVGGGLTMRTSATPIIVSEGLEVGYDLDLAECNLVSLPKGLKVGNKLILQGATIAALPDDLTVGQDLNLMGTPVTTLPKNLKVGRHLHLRETRIVALAEGLWVGGDLNLDYSAIASLPEGLVVKGNLHLPGCEGWDGRIPLGAQVGGVVVTDRHRPNGVFLEDWRTLHPDGDRP